MKLLVLRNSMKSFAGAARLGLGVMFLTLAAHPATHAAEPTALQLQQRGFFHDREYFAVRSGRAQWIIQADRADLGPAVTAYLFDADYIPFNHKHQSYSYTDAEGARASALEVIPKKSGHPFHAYGEHTRARWVESNGIPAVEATWWADGVRVTESFSGMAENNSIRRAITLEGANLHGDEEYTLRLRLPVGNAAATNRALFVTHKGCPQALVVTGDQPIKTDATNGWMEIGPLLLSPAKTVTVETFLLAQIPANTQTAEDFLNQIARASGHAGELIQGARDGWSRAAHLQTDDALVQEVFNHTRAVLPALVSETGVFRVGPFMYASEWVRDNSQFTLGLISSGQFELARAALEHILRDMITQEGTTMIGGGFANPDAEQFDQTGELLLALRWYAELSGDATLVSTYREKLLALAERPLKFRDAGTGLVHNRREFWEQTMADAYELSYNCYVIIGLREAAALAGPLGAQDRKAGWLKEADAMQAAMLKVLVHDDAFIKRRNVTGEIAEHLVNADVLHCKEVPSVNVNHHLIYPDATMALPMALGLVPPSSSLASNTLNQVEKLRNVRWSGGGYDRYDSTSEINMPGPWGIAGALILRGQHAAGQLDRSRRTLEWFRTVTGGNAGLYYEEIPLVVGYPQDAVGLVAWPSGELPYFIVRHYLGLTFEADAVVIRPQLYAGSPTVKADLRFRKGRLNLEIPGPGPFVSADVNGQRVALDKTGAVRLAADFAGGTVVFHRAPTAAAKTYGLLESGLPGLAGAAQRSQAGVTKCTINSTTHGSDVKLRWGAQSWANDMFFGVHGGLYCADAWQANVFRNELEKFSRFVGIATGKTIVPYVVNADGTGAEWNDPGIDLDRCAEFILNTVRVYEFTGDRRFAESMYPKCLAVIDFLRRQDVDHDLLIEGRTLNGPVTGVGSCASVSYIGDTVKNDHKDFGASMFFYDALMHFAKLEDILAEPAKAESHRLEAAALKAAVNKVFWNSAGNGYLAWIERNGTQHDDWITGNNLHAIVCGLADAGRAAAIIGYLDKNRAVIEDIVPCRVRAGTYAKGLCRDADNEYWNGGCWTLVSAPDMMARRITGGLGAAVRVADTLSNKVKTTANGFYESYNGVTGAPNAAYAEGLFMNNSGFLWGVYAGLLGIDTDGDTLVLSPAVPKEVLPAVVRLRYRNADLVIRWQCGEHPRLTVDGHAVPLENSQYRLNLKPQPNQEISIEMTVAHN